MQSRDLGFVRAAMKLLKGRLGKWTVTWTPRPSAGSFFPWVSFRMGRGLEVTCGGLRFPIPVKVAAERRPARSCVLRQEVPDGLAYGQPEDRRHAAGDDR